jgi:hypothetical protein
LQRWRRRFDRLRCRLNPWHDGSSTLRKRRAAARVPEKVAGMPLGVATEALEVASIRARVATLPLEAPTLPVVDTCAVWESGDAGKKSRSRSVRSRTDAIRWSHACHLKSQAKRLKRHRCRWQRFVHGCA